MTTARFRILVLSSPRSSWAPGVMLWASSGAIPADCVQCVSVEELTTRLDSGLRWSAAIVDGSVHAVDRDLLHRLRERRCPPIVVDDGRIVRDWEALGAARVIRPAFDRATLLDALVTVADPVEASGAPLPDVAATGEGSPLRGTVIACCGPGGTGTSTVAAALAEGFARRSHGTVLLDACLQAEQAMLHDAVDGHAGLQELIEAHRTGRPDGQGVRSVTALVERRGYELITGLRRARFWSAVRPTAYAATIESLASLYDVVVIDTDADFETEGDGGSVDVEDRTALARMSVAAADVVLAIGEPSTKGLHALHRVLVDLANAGVAVDRTVPVLNQAVRTPRVRGEYVRALAELGAWRGGDAHPPLFLPARQVDAAHRDGTPFPQAIISALMGCVTPLVTEQQVRAAPPERGQRWRRVRRGELGATAASGGLAP